MVEECNICLEKYNKKINIEGEIYRTGKKISCSKCEYSSCTHCTKKYILDSANDARCMNCQHPWARDFLVENFTKLFINTDYKKHREEMLFQKEKSLIPATMETIDKENQIKELYLQKETLKKKMQEKLYEFDVKIWNLENSSGKSKRTNNRFIKKCGVDECKGFLSSQWKCGLCETHSCNECHEIIGKRIINDDGTSVLPPHECNENNIKTARLMNKECKNCPKCSAPIYKIDGCDQMWCIECKTAFSWKSGEIITGHFHNPHYYEWMRNNNGGDDIPREPGDNPCHISIRTLKNHLNKTLYNNITNFEELTNESKIFISNLDFNNMRDDIDLKYKEYNIRSIVTFLEDVHRFCIHINQININDIDRTCLINDENHLFNYNLTSRRLYLKNIYTETDFKKDIQKNEKKRLKLTDRKQIYQTFINVTNDILQKIVTKKNPKNIILCLKEIINIMNHINKELIKHSNVFNCKIDIIGISKENKRHYDRINYRAPPIILPCVDIKFLKEGSNTNDDGYNINIFI
tara:strand:+ start:232 stop:1797 length:1566 start_codon:yes stop_codon:yes gene_type:complete